MFLLLIFAFFEGMVVFLWMVRSYKRQGFAGILSGILAASLLVYGVVPILLIIFKNAIGRYPNVYGFSDLYRICFTETTWLDYALFIVNCSIGLFALSIGYNSKIFIRKQYYTINNDSNAERLFTYKISLNFTNKRIRKVLWICAFIGIGSLIIYIYALGGLASALSAGEMLRGFSSTVEVNPVLALFKIPSTITPLVFYLSVIVLVSQKRKNYILLTVVSFIFTIIYMFINAGRTNFLILVLFIFYAVLRKRRKNPWIILAVIAICCLPLLRFLDNLFSFLSYGHMANSGTDMVVSLLKYIREFSYPFQIEIHCNDIVTKYDFMWFKNVILDIIGLLPKVGFGQSYYNTSEFIKGMDWKTIGGVPNDLLSYGYLNMGLIGTSLWMLIVGRLARFVDRWLASARIDTYGRDLLAFFLATKAFSHVMSADIQPLIQNDLPFVAVLLMIISIKRTIVLNKYTLI